MDCALKRPLLHCFTIMPARRPRGQRSTGPKVEQPQRRTASCRGRAAPTSQGHAPQRALDLGLPTAPHLRAPGTQAKSAPLPSGPGHARSSPRGRETAGTGRGGRMMVIGVVVGTRGANSCFHKALFDTWQSTHGGKGPLQQCTGEPACLLAGDRQHPRALARRCRAAVTFMASSSGRCSTTMLKMSCTVQAGHQSVRGRPFGCQTAATGEAGVVARKLRVPSLFRQPVACARPSGVH